MDRIVIYKGNRKIRINAYKTGFFSRAIGLMFRTRNTENLLFEFSREGRHSFTSFFVFFPFLMIWLDGKNKVLGSEIVYPFKPTIRPDFSFKRVIEIPVNLKNKKMIDLLVGNEEKV